MIQDIIVVETPENAMYVRVPVRHVDNDDDTRNEGNEYKTTNDDDCD